jgi:hypothetical protein
MGEAGLDTERSDRRDGAPAVTGAERPDLVIAVLDMLTLALGIRLPADVALGPLLTVQSG